MTHAPATSAHTTLRPPHIQWMMTIIGIVAAIACSMIIFSETQQGRDRQNEFQFINAPKLTRADHSLGHKAFVKSLTVNSKWGLKLFSDGFLRHQ